MICVMLIEGEFKLCYYYFYVEDVVCGGCWIGDVKMCVVENEFKIVGVKDCFVCGYQQMGFKEYDIGKQGSWMVQFIDMLGIQESQSK